LCTCANSDHNTQTVMTTHLWTYKYKTCMHIWIYIYIYIHINVYIYIYMHTYMRVHTCIYIYVYIHQYIMCVSCIDSVASYMHVYTLSHPYAYLFTHTHTHTQSYVYTHTHTYQSHVVIIFFQKRYSSRVVMSTKSLHIWCIYGIFIFWSVQQGCVCVHWFQSISVYTHEHTCMHTDVYKQTPNSVNLHVCVRKYMYQNKIVNMYIHAYMYTFPNIYIASQLLFFIHISVDFVGTA